MDNQADRNASSNALPPTGDSNPATAATWIKSHLKDLLLKGTGISLAVAFLVYLATGRNGDLIAWPSQITPIYPSSQTKDLPLGLSLGTVKVDSVTFINMNISNFGKTTIGGQQEPWVLQITGPPEATLKMLGPSANSKRLVLSGSDGPIPNVVTASVGSLEPREFFDLRFIVVNATHPTYPLLKVSTSLHGLPPPVLTYESPAARGAHRLLLWLWAALFLAMMYEAIRDRHRPEKAPKLFENVKSLKTRLIGQAAVALFISLFGAWILSSAFGWTAVTLWRMGVIS